jgi:hypothetical protein
MSPWAPESPIHEQDKRAPGPEAGSPEPASAGGLSTEPPSARRGPAYIPLWVKAVPFFLSAFLFLSGLFAIFSPIPILFLHFQSGRRYAWLAAATNLLLVTWAGNWTSLGGGWTSAAIYGVFVLSLGLSLPEYLRARRPLDLAAFLALVTMGVTGALWIAADSHFRHVNPWTELRNQTSQLVDTIGTRLNPTVAPSDSEEPPATPQELKESLLVEMPSAILVFSLVLIWANVVLLFRLNPSGLRERLGVGPSYFRKWKAPDWLIWPTIGSAFLLITDQGWPSDVALNLFKFLMAIYAIQGLSILSFFFDVWNVRGLLRTLAYLLAVFLMMPLLLLIGVADLWIDFRGKLRQS